MLKLCLRDFSFEQATFHIDLAPYGDPVLVVTGEINVKGLIPDAIYSVKLVEGAVLDGHKVGLLKGVENHFSGQTYTFRQGSSQYTWKLKIVNHPTVRKELVLPPLVGDNSYTLVIRPVETTTQEP